MVLKREETSDKCTVSLWLIHVLELLVHRIVPIFELQQNEEKKRAASYHIGSSNVQKTRYIKINIDHFLH